MQFQVKTGTASQQRTACAIVPIYCRRRTPAAARSLDTAGGGLITRAIRNRDIKGEFGELLLLTDTGDLPCQRILLVGLGPEGQARSPGLAEGHAERPRRGGARQVQRGHPAPHQPSPSVTPTPTAGRDWRWKSGTRSVTGLPP